MWKRHRKFFEEMREQDREFHQHLLARMEYSERRHVDALNKLGDRIDAGTREIQALTQEVLDHRDEGKALLQALLRILDRLDGNGGTAPA